MEVIEQPLVESAQQKEIVGKTEVKKEVEEDVKEAVKEDVKDEIKEEVKEVKIEEPVRKPRAKRAARSGARRGPPQRWRPCRGRTPGTSPGAAGGPVIPWSCGPRE